MTEAESELRLPALRRMASPWLQFDDSAVLLLARAGTVSLVARTARLRIRAGQAAIVPPGLRHRVEHDEGAVVVPVLVPLVVLPAGVLAMTPFAIPVSWGDWLLAQFVTSLDFLPARERRPDEVETVLKATVVEGQPKISFPPPPRSRTARMVAAQIRAQPAVEATVDAYAAMAGVDVRTLGRIFWDETGLSVGRWRTRHRLALAAEGLRRGEGVAAVAAAVGYCSVASFSHAFRRSCGMPPGRFARQGASASVTEVVLPAEPPVPAATASWTRINPFDVALWAYRGAVRIEFPWGEVCLRDNELALVPAGVPNAVRLADGAVAVPVGFAPPTSPKRVRGRAVRLPGGAADALVQAAVLTYTPYCGAGFDPHEFTRVLRRFTEEADGADAPALAPRVAEYLTDGKERAVPRDGPDVAAFVAEAGMPLASWRRWLRMTNAREYLANGLPADVVARRVGYAHVSALGKAFATAHGMTPRAYQRKEQWAVSAELSDVTTPDGHATSRRE